SQGRSHYRLDAEKLRELQPELIVTQDLCHVCAASPDDLAAVLGTLSPCPQVLALTPRTIADVWNDIITVGNATGRTAEATALVANLEQKIAQVRKHQSQNSPRVLCLEWLDPPFAAYCGRGCCTGGNLSRTDSRSPQKNSFSGPWLG